MCDLLESTLLLRRRTIIPVMPSQSQVQSFNMEHIEFGAVAACFTLDAIYGPHTLTFVLYSDTASILVLI